MNALIISGNVGFVELKTGSTPILKFNLAVNEKYKTGDGVPTERTDWFRCVVFGTRAEQLAKYIEKGRKLLVRGRVRFESYTNAEGVKMSTTEVVVDDVEFLSSNRNNATNNAGPEYQGTVSDIGEVV